MASNNTVTRNFVVRKWKWWGMHKAAHQDQDQRQTHCLPVFGSLEDSGWPGCSWYSFQFVYSLDCGGKTWAWWLLATAAVASLSSRKDIWRAATPRYWLVRIRQIKSSLLPPNTNSKWLTGADGQVAWIKTRYGTVVIWSIVIQKMSSVMMHITSHCQP